MIKKGNAPKTFPAKLELVGIGEKAVLNVVYHNRKTSELDAKVQEITEELKGTDAVVSEFAARLALWLVSEWDAEYSLSLEGFLEAEDERPQFCRAIIEGYHRTRQVKLEGN